MPWASNVTSSSHVTLLAQGIFELLYVRPPLVVDICLLVVDSCLLGDGSCFEVTKVLHIGACPKSEGPLPRRIVLLRWLCAVLARAGKMPAINARIMLQRRVSSALTAQTSITLERCWYGSAHWQDGVSMNNKLDRH